MRYAVLFPGQGSQAVGMGADVFAARPDLLGDIADEVLGWSLETVCAEGPEELLTRTDRAQPALYAIAYALWAELRDRLAEPPRAAAGHSLGEYTALASSGALAFDEGLRLVAARGRAMAAAAAATRSTMAALIGADEETAGAIAAIRRAEGGSLWVANLNAPGQVVLAGGEDDIAWLTDNARDLGARRAIPLKVAGAFHSPMMAPAADALRASLASTRFGEGSFPVFSNVTAAPIEDPAEALSTQLVSPVRFAESLLAMARSGVEAFVHVGPGDVTAGMARRTIPDAVVVALSSLDDVGGVAEALNVQ